MNKNDIDIFV